MQIPSLNVMLKALIEHESGGFSFLRSVWEFSDSAFRTGTQGFYRVSSKTVLIFPFEAFQVGACRPEACVVDTSLEIQRDTVVRWAHVEMCGVDRSSQSAELFFTAMEPISLRSY